MVRVGTNSKTKRREGPRYKYSGVPKVGRTPYTVITVFPHTNPFCGFFC